MSGWGVYSQLTNMPDTATALHKAILKGIQAPCAFAALAGGDGWVACGLAVLEQNLLGLFDIVTHILPAPPWPTRAD